MAKRSKGQGEKIEEILSVIKVETGALECYVVGLRPLVQNCQSEKTVRGLLFPSGRKTAVEKATTLKHDPLMEYRDSVYRLNTGPTLLALPAAAFKGVLKTAALDTQGAKKTQVGRLTWVEGDDPSGDFVSVYGVPQLYMANVRNSDPNHTPDVRTRAIVPQWAARVRITFMKPMFTAQGVANLLASGGMTCGVGDGRNEKGTFTFGRFRLASADDPDVKRIVAAGQRKQQEAALTDPDPQLYDDFTRRIYPWFVTELAARKRRGESASSARHLEEQLAEGVA